MTRTVLNTFPDALLVPAAVLLVGVIAWVLHGVVRGCLPGWGDRESSESVLAVSGMVMMLFALVLAFLTVDLATNFSKASESVTAEANALNEITHDAGALPPVEQRRVDGAVDAYASEVREHEFPAMRDGRDDPPAERRLAAISASLEAYSPTTSSEIAFYQSAVDNVGNVVAARRARLGYADSSIPAPFVALLLILGAVSLGVSAFLRTNRFALDRTLVLAIAVVVGAGLVTVAILEHPFSGSIAVSSHAFVDGALGHLRSGAG